MPYGAGASSTWPRWQLPTDSVHAPDSASICPPSTTTVVPAIKAAGIGDKQQQRARRGRRVLTNRPIGMWSRHVGALGGKIVAIDLGYHIARRNRVTRTP